MVGDSEDYDAEEEMRKHIQAYEEGASTAHKRVHVIQIPRSRLKWIGYSLAMLMLSVIATGALCVWYTNWKTEDSIKINNATFCEFLVPLDARNDQIPNKTPEQIKVSQSFRKMIHKLGC